MRWSTVSDPDCLDLYLVDLNAHFEIRNWIETKSPSNGADFNAPSFTFLVQMTRFPHSNPSSIGSEICPAVIVPLHSTDKAKLKDKIGVISLSFSFRDHES